MLASNAIKTPPTYLNCHVSLNVDPELESDLRKPNFYNDPEKNDADPDDDEEEEKPNQEDIAKLYYKQLEEQKSFLSTQKNRTGAALPNPLLARKRSKRSPQDVLTTEWSRDGSVFIATNKTEKKPISENGFTLYPNGTLRFQGSNTTAGEYRCTVKYTASGGKFSIGPIVSQATVVEAACKQLLKLLIVRT